MAVVQPLHALEPESGVPPRADWTDHGGSIEIVLSGAWTGEHARQLEALTQPWLPACQGARSVAISLAAVTRLDTVGAFLIERFRFDLGSDGIKLQVLGSTIAQQQLLREVAKSRLEPVQPAPHSGLISILADVGEGVAGAGRDTVRGVGFLGEVMIALARAFLHPAKFRQAALTNQLEQIAFRGAPIIMLISFLVGCIVTQQSIFQMQRFGATIFVVNLAGILILRELAVLLTAIMVAGRSGSAFTAEIGSMKMREEIDALRVMGLDPDRGAGRAAHPGAGDLPADPRPSSRSMSGLTGVCAGLLALWRHRHRHLPGAAADRSSPGSISPSA